MEQFVGRHRELRQLRDLFDRKIASLVVVKGRRRIGKSRLIEEFAKEAKFISISGLAPTKGVTSKHQREEFARQVARIFSTPTPAYDNWSDLFWFLANQTKKSKVVILLDEISWMGSKDPTFLGKLKNAWDLHFKKNPSLILVLCGSVSSWIEKNILSSTEFVGRIDLTITLGELSLAECNVFWKKQKDNISSYEKFKILSIIGGIPRYLELISSKYNAEENIKQLCFVKEGFLFNEFDKIFNDLFVKKNKIYKEIIACLIQIPYATLDDIFNYLGIEKSGGLNSYIDNLITSGFIKRDYTWNLKNETLSKFSHFRISDNYIRFYFNYILPNKLKIESDAFTDRSLTMLPGWEGIMGLQFENLVLQNRRAIQKILHIDPNEIIHDNPYFQKTTSTQKGCQIDYMIQTRFNSLSICEIKFSKKPIRDDVILAMKNKIESLNLPKNFSYRPVLIHVNGVEDDVIASDYFANIIDFGELLSLV